MYSKRYYLYPPESKISWTKRQRAVPLITITDLTINNFVISSRIEVDIHTTNDPEFTGMLMAKFTTHSDEDRRSFDLPLHKNAAVIVPTIIRYFSGLHPLAYEELGKMLLQKARDHPELSEKSIIAKNSKNASFQIEAEFYLMFTQILERLFADILFRTSEKKKDLQVAKGIN